MIKLCILFVSLSIAYAAVGIYPYEPKPPEFEDEEGCWISDLKMVLPYNEPYYPKDGKSCLQYTCGTNNETQVFSCGVFGLPDDCHLEHDYSLDYPKCCGTAVCTSTTTVPTTTTEVTTEDTCITVTTK